MTEPTAKSSRLLAPWLDWIIVLLGIALAALLGAVIIRNSDVWLHLATGRSIAHGHYRAGADPFSFGAGDQKWINHSWLFDLGIYQLYKLFGDVGVVLVRCVVTVGIFLAALTVRKPNSRYTLAAVGAILALVAANGRLPYFQPVTVSYLFLAILIALLHHGGPKLPIWVGVLCAVWVNVDGWFILAPLTVALCLIGSLTQRNAEVFNVRLLLLTLGAALVGGLINPHHIFAYTFPDDLALMLFAPEAAADAQFRSYFESGFANLAPASAYTFYVLLSVGATSFVLRATDISMSRLLVWIAFAALALWRWRFVPFFAVAGTPLVVLNIQEVLARADGAQPVRMIAFALRALAAGGAALLVFAAWPGWLGPAVARERLYRVGPHLVADPAVERVTTQINDLISAGRLSPGEKVLSQSIDVAQHMAWFAPQARSFVDSRWRLFLPKLADYVAVRQALANERGLADVERFIGNNKVQGIITLGSDEGAGAARVFWVHPDRFAFRALVGRTAYFGVSDPQAGDPHPELRLDPARLAFAPQAPPEWQRPPFAEPQLPTFWETYWRGVPPTPLGAHAGNAWMEYIQVEAGRQSTMYSAWWSSVVGYLGMAAVGASPFSPFDYMRASLQGVPPSQLLGRPEFNSNLAAAPVLGVRELRAAQFKVPADAGLRMRIGEAYQFWAIRFGNADLQTGLIKLQRVAALRQAMNLLERSPADLETARLMFFCADLLAGYHFENQQYDLGIVAARQSLSVFGALGPNFQEEFQKRAKQQEQFEEQLRTLRKQFEESAKNDSPGVRFQRAIAVGLPGEALTIAQSAKVDSGISPFMLLQLLVQIGRAEEARIIMHEKLPAASVPPNLRGEYLQLKFHADAASGDFPGALVAATDCITEIRSDINQAAKEANATIGAFAIAGDLFSVPGMSRVAVMPFWLEGLVQSRRAQSELHNMLVRQGLIALQAGDTRVARQAMDESLHMRSNMLGFMSQDEAALHKSAELYGSLLQAASKEP